ncbi:hypothetical protein WJX72_008789 [[Myrmecia] bisecta]|uniref:GAF domain-containing protein n=1 Tax=[Myrmecia] bisecta TaxID=41462 RepID=A0AAW1Q1F7_9CHLO
MQAQTGEAAGAAPGTPDRASVQKADPAIAARLAVALGGCSSDNELFRVAAEACHQLTGDVCHVSVAILSHKEDVLYFFKLSRELSGTHEHIGSLPLDWSAAGSAVQLKSAVCHGHIANSGRRYVDWQHFRATCGAVAVVSAPLIVADKVLGVLSIASKREDAFAGSLRGVEAVAAVVAPLVGLQRFRRELKSTENLLRRMLPAHTMDRLHELQAPLQHAQPANDFGLLGLVWGTMWSSMLRVIPAAFCVAALAALLLPVGMLLAGKHDVPGIRCLRTLLSMPRAAVDMFGTCLMRQARWTTVIGTALLLGALLLALQAKFGPVRGAVYGSVHLVNTLLIGGVEKDGFWPNAGGDEFGKGKELYRKRKEAAIAQLIKDNGWDHQTAQHRGGTCMKDLSPAQDGTRMKDLSGWRGT